MVRPKKKRGSTHIPSRKVLYGTGRRPETDGHRIEYSSKQTLKREGERSRVRVKGAL